MNDAQEGLAFRNEDVDDPKIPWHFWVGVGLVCLYLGFRLIQMLVLGFNAIF